MEVVRHYDSKGSCPESIRSLRAQYMVVLLAVSIGIEMHFHLIFTVRYVENEIREPILEMKKMRQRKAINT